MDKWALRTVVSVFGSLTTVTLIAGVAFGNEDSRDIRTAAREDAAIFIERDLPCDGSVPSDLTLYSPIQCSARGVTTFVYFEEPIPLPRPEFSQVREGWSRPISRPEGMPPENFRLLSAMVRQTSHNSVTCIHFEPLGESVAIQEAFCWLTFSNSRGGTRTIFADFQDMGRWSMGRGQPLDEHEFRIYVENFVLGISALL